MLYLYLAGVIYDNPYIIGLLLDLGFSLAVDNRLNWRELLNFCSAIRQYLYSYLSVSVNTITNVIVDDRI